MSEVEVASLVSAAATTDQVPELQLWSHDNPDVGKEQPPVTREDTTEPENPDEEKTKTYYLEERQERPRANESLHDAEGLVNPVLAKVKDGLIDGEAEDSPLISTDGKLDTVLAASGVEEDPEVSNVECRRTLAVGLTLEPGTCTERSRN